MHNVFDIQEYGARGDGTTLNTVPIQRAIDTCHLAGGGRVQCGPGNFLTGTIELKSNVELHLASGCRLVGSPALNDYAPLRADGFNSDAAPEGAFSLIRASGANNISITGSGEINGNGLMFYNDIYTSSRGTVKFKKPSTPRPRLIMFYNCHNVHIAEITCVDAACWTFWLMQCENVNVHAIKIRADRRMQNIDGIDLDACRNVTISDCTFDTEDDCLAVRAIQQAYTKPAVCENIVVTNCIFSSDCQGIRIGCPNDGTIRHGVFSNLVINSRTHGIAFEYPARYICPTSNSRADVSDIQFNNIAIKADGSPVRLFVEPGIVLQRLAEISFSNMRVHGGSPCTINGNADTVIQNVCFSNVEITTAAGNAFVLEYCTMLKLDRVVIAQNSGAE